MSARGPCLMALPPVPFASRSISEARKYPSFYVTGLESTSIRTGQSMSVTTAVLIRRVAPLQLCVYHTGYHGNRVTQDWTPPIYHLYILKYLTEHVFRFPNLELSNETNWEQVSKLPSFQEHFDCKRKNYISYHTWYFLSKAFICTGITIDMN